MADIKINRITNANVYSSGNSLLGRVEEVKLPAIKSIDTDVKVLGLQMAIKLHGGFESMAGSMKFNAVYPELIKEFGSPMVTRQVQVRKSLETYDSSGLIAQLSAVAYMTIRFKDVLPPITLKQNENPEQESEFNCSYYRYEIDGKRIVEIDAFTNTFFVMDNDQLATYRTNLGF